jgi:hypothetical protein
MENQAEVKKMGISNIAIGGFTAILMSEIIE